MLALAFYDVLCCFQLFRHLVHVLDVVVVLLEGSVSYRSVARFVVLARPSEWNNLPLLRSSLDAKTTNKSSNWCIDSVGLHFMFVIFLHFFTLHSTLQQMDFVHLSALKNRMGDLKD